MTLPFRYKSAYNHALFLIILCKIGLLFNRMYLYEYVLMFGLGFSLKQSKKPSIAKVGKIDKGRNKGSSRE